MIDTYSLRRTELDIKYAKLIAIAEDIVDWAYNNVPNLIQIDAPESRPSRTEDILLCGKFYSENELHSAFADAYQEYEALFRSESPRY